MASAMASYGTVVVFLPKVDMQNMKDIFVVNVIPSDLVKRKECK